MFKDSYIIAIHDSDKKQPPRHIKHVSEIPALQTAGYGIFFSVNQFPTERKKELCTGINAWAIDMDNKDIPKYIQKMRIDESPLPPSKIVETKNGHHLYWMAKDGEISQYSNVISRLISFFDGDENAKDISRLLRMPNTLHLKDPKEPFKVELIKNDSCEYSQEDMLNAFKESNGPIKKTFYEFIKSQDTRKMLDFFSGKPEVKGEIFTYETNTNGTVQIVVNGNKSSCWLDSNGLIGSYANGGPTIIQWLQYYGHSKRNIVDMFKRYGLWTESEQILESIENGDIYEKNNCYFQANFKKKGIRDDEQLTNFIIRIQNIFKNTSTYEYLREFTFINQDNEKAGPFKIDAEIFSSWAEFKRFCLSRGNYLCFATERALPRMQEYILRNSKDFRTVNLIPRIGYIPKFNIWIFPSYAIKDGQIIKADEKGIIWDEEVGYQSYTMDENTEDSIGSDGGVSPGDIKALTSFYIKSVIANYGDDRIKLAISWMFANIFSYDILRSFKLFPLLYIYGKTRSGKDVLSTILSSLFGLSSNIKESLPQMRSTVGIARKAEYYAWLPIILDEYKNTPNIERYDGFFKNLASKTGVTKGTINKGEIRRENIYSNFIFTSEELPEDPAILNRSAIIRINPSLRNDAYFPEINRRLPEFLNIGIHWLCESAKYKDAFFDLVNSLKDFLIQNGITTYTSEVYAISGAGYACIVEMLDLDDDIIAYRDLLLRMAKEDNSQKEESDKLAMFWSDLNTIHAKNNFNGTTIIQKENDTVYFWAKYAVDAWNEFLKAQGKPHYPYKAINDLLKEYPCLINYRVTKRMGNKQCKCLSFKYNDLPHDFRLFVDSYLNCYDVVT